MADDATTPGSPIEVDSVVRWPTSGFGLDLGRGPRSGSCWLRGIWRGSSGHRRHGPEALRRLGRGSGRVHQNRGFGTADRAWRRAEPARGAAHRRAWRGRCSPLSEDSIARLRAMSDRPNARAATDAAGADRRECEFTAWPGDGRGGRAAPSRWTPRSATAADGGRAKFDHAA